MSVVIIGPGEQAEIDKIRAEARKNYIPWEKLVPSVLPPTHEVTLKDRLSVPERPDNRHIVLGDTLTAYSCEEQPVGICAHISVSVRRKGKLPHPAAVEMICKAFGFTSFPPPMGSIWIEEFEPGHQAVNVVEVLEPYEEQRTAELARLVNSTH